jgi:hypothetical protein
MTKRQVRERSKTVTRRFGWWFLKPGDLVCAVEKGMGLKAGEKINRLATIRIVSTRAEPLNAITKDDVAREGFPTWTPAQFVNFLADHYACPIDKEVNRIEFEYVDALVWSDELPTATGWYWCWETGRKNVDGEDDKRVVWIHLHPRLGARFTDRSPAECDRWKGLWAGPIPEPKS